MPSPLCISTYCHLRSDSSIMVSSIIDRTSQLLLPHQWLVLNGLVASLLLIILYRLIQIYLAQDQLVVGSEAIATKSQEMIQISTPMLRTSRTVGKCVEGQKGERSLFSRKKKALRKRLPEAGSVRGHEAVHGPITISIQNWAVPPETLAPSQSYLGLKAECTRNQSVATSGGKSLHDQESNISSQAAEQVASAPTPLVAKPVDRGFLRIPNDQRFADSNAHEFGQPCENTLFHDIIAANQQMRT
jgi:hypothetical protein